MRAVFPISFAVLLLLALQLLPWAQPVPAQAAPTRPLGPAILPPHQTTPAAELVNGYLVSDADGIPFLTTYRSLGTDIVGLPISRRFTWDGFTVQAFQKVIMQWQPGTNQVYFLNVMDIMHDRELDGWLQTVRATPPPLPPSFDAGLTDFGQIQARRLGLLDENLAIRAHYEASPVPLLQYGLPTSHVVDNGSHYVMRFQRVIMQQWKERVPWAEPGQVTIANGGDIAKEVGLLPAAALRPNAGSGVEQAVDLAVARFERGHLIWRGDTREIYVITDNGAYATYPDNFVVGEPERAGLTPPAGLYEPIRGFGKVWQTQPGVRDRVGWQAAPEQGVRGTVIDQPDGTVIVDARGLGRWVLYPTGRADKVR